MADEAQPLPDGALPRVAPLAWKTGTSYGYRDAWAIGVNARYVIGIWTGRPDGTPVVGQFGFASAIPLLNQVNNILLSRSVNFPEDPRPDSVSRGVICWPGGQSLPEGDGNCRRRLATWLLDGSQPPLDHCRSRKALMAFVSPSGWMKTANVLPLIALRRDKK